MHVSTENTLLVVRALAVALFPTVIVAACRQAPPRATTSSPSVRPTYDKATGTLTRLEADSDRDGLVDTWGYMFGAHVVRVEIDENGDGIVDRWEYHKSPPGAPDSRQGPATESVGRMPVPQAVKLRRGGVESPDKTIERIERATRRDGVVSRWEFFDNGLLTRVEEDKNGDGKIDKWETYTDGSLSTMAIDTTLHRGKPDRRLIYLPNGTLDRIEVDPTGSGTFQLASQAVR